MMPLAKALAAASSTEPLRLVPCRVTQVTPLRIDFYDTPTYPAVKIAGLTYSVGAALALISSPGTPVVLPIGV